MKGGSFPEMSNLCEAAGTSCGESRCSRHNDETRDTELRVVADARERCERVLSNSSSRRLGCCPHFRLRGAGLGKDGGNTGLASDDYGSSVGVVG